MKKYLLILATLFTLGAVLASTPSPPAPAPAKTLAELAKALGLQPADYAQLVVVFGESGTKAVIKLQAELHLDKAKFRAEFRSIAAGLIDLVQAGVPKDAAKSFLRSALAADPRLEEVTTMTAGLVDLVEAGLPLDTAKEVARLAIITDPSLEEFTTITAAAIDLHQAGATPGEIIALLKLVERQVEAGVVSRTLLLEEISTIAAAKVDLLEAGIPAVMALVIIQEAIALDRSLEELTTITARVIDLKAEGKSISEALVTARAEAAQELNGDDDDEDDKEEDEEDQEDEDQNDNGDGNNGNN
jgi:hypothetical protein